MKTPFVATLALAASSAYAQRPSSMSICDYYTTALLKDNNATNQQTLLTLVVNTVVIGNYTKPNVGISVPGILNNGTGDYEGVSLLPYFNGALASTNRNGKAVSVNFLADGGATPLMMDKPANGTTSAQYILLTHLYEYFAGLLGCSEFSKTTGMYAGSTSMYEVHKYMALDSKQVGWFIHNVGLAAASFGVAMDDVTIVGNSLTKAFDYRCSAPASIPASAQPALQAICIADDCMSANASCSAYASVVQPQPASMSMSSGSSSGSMSMTMSSSMASGSAMPSMTTGSMSGSASASSSPSTNDAGSLAPGLSAILLGAVAYLL